jgi:hypothetical protein
LYLMVFLPFPKTSFYLADVFLRQINFVKMY